ncbi:MAG: DUF2071 domain-containing protein [Crocinitomicaceae bacterium]|nr:DUF2071 domain-containing protein [Crocinitomicaceae bacterium]
MNFLKNHPFAVEAHFDSSLVLTFAVPKEQLQNLIPECLELDIFQDKWAFIAIAMVQTRGLRPKGFPKFMGNDFFLIGYRIFVRYTNNAGKRLRGLYIIKSQTDKKKMEFFGNIFTHYKYTTTDIRQTKSENFKTIKSDQSKFEVSIKQMDDKVEIPEGSPFTDWKDARKFAGPLPHTFTVNTKDRTILTILGVRKNWKPEPLKVESYHFDFLNQLQLQNIVLANAFEIKNVPYYWEKGKLEKWK